VLVHLRLTVPNDLTERVSELLVGHECTTNVTLQAGVVSKPEGDLVECDVAREEAGSLLRMLEEIELDERGGILIETPTGTPFREARRLERLAPGHPDDAVIWEGVEAEAYAGATATVSYLIFLVLAVILAAIAVLTDSSILVVGAMVVGALALAIQKTATMVGVFISVTTVPAAGNLALGLAVWNLEEITGSAAQLGINIAGMIISGTLLLLVVRTSWPWIMTHTERLLGLRPWRVSEET